MSALEWNMEFELGIESIDRQHRELYRKIDHLSLSIYQGKGKDELRQLIKYLKSYIEEHFTYEENILERTDYPDLEAHKQQHLRFIDYFKELDHEIKSRGADNFLAIKVEKEIRTWWTQHELKFDRLYVPYLAGKP